MDEYARLLTDAGVLLEGHFLLTSGRHSDRYFEKFRILENPPVCTRFAAALADRFRDAGITAVCGPTTGGIIIAYEVARLLAARCIIAEKTATGRKIGRGFRLQPEDRVLVVDDVLTTGGSLLDTLAALEAYPSEVVGLGVYIDRSGADCALPLPCASVYRRPVETWPPEDCPLCRQGIPLVAPGRGK